MDSTKPWIQKQNPKDASAGVILTKCGSTTEMVVEQTPAAPRTHEEPNVPVGNIPQASHVVLL